MPAQVSLSHSFTLVAAWLCTAHVMHTKGIPGSASSFWGWMNIMQELVPGAELHRKPCRRHKRRRMSWTLSYQYEVHVSEF